MRKVLIVLMSLLLAATAFATTIKDIQNGTVSAGTVVTVSGIVTGESYAFGGSDMYIQDGTGPYCGIALYLGSAGLSNFVADSVIVSEGDSVTVTGTVGEYYDVTQISVTSLVLEEAGVGCPAPVVAPLDSLNQEKYEGCLVRALDVAISNPDAGYGEWEIEDASGTMLVDDEGKAPYYFWPDEYDSLISITGIVNYSYYNYKIMPRLAWDIVEGPPTGETTVFTRIQRIQQVRVSDLKKALTDAASDTSYICNEDTTIYIKGIVTMPTGLSYAGDGIKFILSDIHGGPWSAILSYNADASVYADMFVGDLIEMGGYVGEYTTGPSNMTEFWLVGDAELVDMVSPPDPAVITTSDLRIPETAEQWGNVNVRIEDAIVTENELDNYILEIDDGSGACLVDDDSDSLSQYANNPFVAPPIFTPIESITGWIYHHYGSYADSTTYSICPLYHEDIVLGEGPAMLLEPKRSPVNIPTSSQSVVASITISTLRNIDTAKVYYKVNNGTLSNVDMVEGTENKWSGTIPPQADGSIVEYYFYVTDDSLDVSALPSNYEDGGFFTYKVLDSAPTVYDIQYTHAVTGISPLHGCNVTFDATVTTPGVLASNIYDDNDFGVMAVASAPGMWNGVWVLADPATVASFVEGDLVTVSGKVDDDHEAYWKWQKNTYVVGTVTEKLIGETPIAPTVVTLSDLENNKEAYEGVLVEIDDDMEISSINDYDFTLTDGLGSFLYDDDLVADSILDINYRENAVVGGTDTLVAGDSLSNVKGVVYYGYSSIKIEARKVSDITIKPTSGVGVADVPANFALHQNYPNPFNPVTTIRFDLANATNVKLTIYDINGRKIQELVNTNMNAGSYDLRWNASKLSSGMYLYRLETPEFISTNKLVLLK